MVMYGGDEVSALVIDIGSSSVRAGYAGDDTPKAVIPSSFGFRRAAKEQEDVLMQGQENGDSASSNGSGQEPRKSAYREVFAGQSGPALWRSKMEVGNPLVDGLIADFEPIPHLIRHAVTSVLQCDPTEHPVLLTEPSWNTPANRERMAEIMFEEFQVPAFYIANTGVLNAFAAGKGSALVIDLGESTASVTPVVDGFVLRKGLAHSALPKLIHNHAKHMLTQKFGVELWPHQLIGSKSPVDPNTKPIYKLRDDRIPAVTQSWREWAENREVDEWVQSVAGTLDQGWNDQAAAARPPKQYEFPTGYNSFFGYERLTIGEQFFHHSPSLIAANPNLPQTIPALIMESLRACDPELRQVLVGNIVLTGGTSLFSGLADRLSNELARHFPHVKIHAPGNPIERRYGGWLGGSILASLGTFHQLWVSREEWQEHGKAIIGQRCK
ncbi:actin family [Pterulicium gracile]|uniref:Actin family n=1 Tax=Pterulicium gracile TaxID=1884261 RepID=A0A5C3QFP8_9AGAR|nr:actin family [Pterula gracilis]